MRISVVEETYSESNYLHPSSPLCPASPTLALQITAASGVLILQVRHLLEPSTSPIETPQLPPSHSALSWSKSVRPYKFLRVLTNGQTKDSASNIIFLFT
jgi:hypothetical protein